MAGNTNFDAILTTTLNNHRATLEDNVFSDRPLLARVGSDGKIKFKNGGAKIVVPLLYGKNTTAGSYSQDEALGITRQEGISAAEYPWRQYAASVVITGLEEAQNDGEEAVIDLLEGKTFQTEETIKENFDDMFFKDGSGNSSKDWYGLALLVGDDLSAITSVGGIDCAVAGNEFWRSTVKDENSAVRNDDTWTNAVNSASKGNDKFTFGLTTQDLYEHYEASLAPALRLQSNKEADARFEHLLFKGRPMYFDEYCQSGVTYFLNEKYLHLAAHRKNWFRNTPFQMPVDKDIRVAQVICYGNMTCSNRSRQAKVTEQTV